jgi:hypothetical protein
MDCRRGVDHILGPGRGRVTSRLRRRNPCPAPCQPPWLSQGAGASGGVHYGDVEDKERGQQQQQGKKSAMIFDVLQVKTRARWKNPGSRCRQLAATSCWVQTVATQTGKFPAREPLKACQDQQVPKIFDSLICSVRTCLLGKRTIGSERAQDPPSQGPNSQGPAPPEPEQQEVQVQRPTSKRGRALLVS